MKHGTRTLQVLLAASHVLPLGHAHVESQVPEQVRICRHITQYNLLVSAGQHVGYD